MSTNLVDVLADLTDAGDIISCRLSSGGRTVLLQDPPGIYDATPENLPHHLPASHPDRERSRRIDAALSDLGYRFVGRADTHDVSWLHFIYW